MINTWSNSINQSCSSERINNILDYINVSDNISQSPIDIFYRSIREILVVADPIFLETHNSIGPLLLVGIVSATENYFRDMLSRVIELCPIAQACSAGKTVNLGSVIWHSGINLERGSFENISLAGADNIRSTCNGFLKYNIDHKGLTSAILLEYDKVCELRHSIVHSGSIIAGKNAIKLGISPCDKTVSIKVGYDQVQECASICTTLIISFNIEIFKLMCKRWAIDWPKMASWDSNKKNELFNRIWKAFFSQIDETNGSIVEKISMIKCRNMVKKEFHII